MAEFTADELLTPITREQFTASIYDGLATIGVTTTTWKPGAVTRTIIAVCAVIFAALSSLIASIARGGYLQLAEGLWLRLKALYDYGEAQQLATFAAGTVLITNSSGGVYTLDPDDLEVQCTLTGKSYKNTVTVTIGAGAIDVPVAMQAVEAGSASTALVGEIDRVVTAFPGLSVRNAVALVGLDDESAELLRTRCTEKIGSFSPNGPSDAYTYVARSAKRTNGTPIGVNRLRVVRDLMGKIYLYLATPTGAVDPADVTVIDEELQRKACTLGVTLDVSSATTVSVPVTYQAVCYRTSGITEQNIKDAIASGLAAYFADPTKSPIGGNAIPPEGGKIFAADVANEIGRTTYKGVKIPFVRVTLTAPAADVALSVSQVAVVGAVSGTLTQLATPQGSVV
jgi:phage-related baseplate assembly protein